MTKKALLFAIVTSAIGSACAQMGSQSSDYGAGSRSAGPRSQSPTSAAVCTSSPCEHTLTIDTSANPCTVRIEPNIMYVKHVPNAVVTWKLDAPDRFKIVDLRFKDEQKSWLEEYGKRVATPSHKQFHDKHVNPRGADVIDDNTIDGAWYYSVVVSDGHTTCKYDPPIINGE